MGLDSCARTQNAPPKMFTPDISHWSLTAVKHHPNRAGCTQRQQSWALSSGAIVCAAGDFSLEKCCKFLTRNPFDTVRSLTLTKFETFLIHHLAVSTGNTKGTSSTFQPDEMHLMQEATAKSWVTLPVTSLTLSGEHLQEKQPPGLGLG